MDTMQYFSGQIVAELWFILGMLLLVVVLGLICIATGGPFDKENKEEKTKDTLVQ